MWGMWVAACVVEDLAEWWYDDMGWAAEVRGFG